MIIDPSVLSLDYSKLSESMDALNRSQAKWLHYDVMDGHFVPNLTFGLDIFKGLRAMTDLFMDVHFMVDYPQDYALDYIKAGANLVTIHAECFETIQKLKDFISEVKQAGGQVGITSKPGMDPAWYEAVLADVDLVLVMSVEPGFGGQSFMPAALDKIQRFDQLRKDRGYSYLIQVDGGINQETIHWVKEAGVDVSVAGSYIFKGDIQKQITSLLV